MGLIAALTLDLAVHALQRVGAVDIGAVLPGGRHERQHVLLGRVHQGGEFRHPGAELVREGTHLRG